MTESQKLLDLGVVITLVFVASLLTTTLTLNFLTTTLLFFGLPSAYLLYKKPNNLKKATIMASVFGLIWGFSFDYIAELNNAWNWASNTNLVIPFELFEVVSLDIMIWYFFWILSVITFYEYFVEYDNVSTVSKNALPIALTGLVVAMVVVLLSKTTSLLNFSHTYFWLGTATLFPYSYVVIRRPKLFFKSLMVVPYFCFLYFVFELTALSAELWSFPGEYIGLVTISGLSFPLEELFYWIIVSSAVTVAYYEHAVDDLA